MTPGHCWGRSSSAPATRRGCKIAAVMLESRPVIMLAFAGCALTAHALACTAGRRSSTFLPLFIPPLASHGCRSGRRGPDPRARRVRRWSMCSPQAQDATDDDWDVGKSLMVAPEVICYFHAVLEGICGCYCPRREGVWVRAQDLLRSTGDLSCTLKSVSPVCVRRGAYHAQEAPGPDHSARALLWR